MKKIFYIGGKYDGCYYYRCELPIKYMKKYDTAGSIDLKKGVTDKSLDTAKKILNADIVVFQRPASEVRMMLAYKLFQKGKKIVFENDDTFDIDDDNPAKSYSTGHKYAYAVLRNAHLATTTTAELAKEFKKYNKNVKVIPNLIDFEKYRLVKEKKTKNTTPRVGIIGSVAFLENSKKMKRVFDKIKDDVKFVVFGFNSDKFYKKNKITGSIFKKHRDFWKRYNVEFVDVVPIRKYQKKLLSLNLDFAIIPRKDNHFNRCKSNVKYLELSACKIPVIAQKFNTKGSPYDEIIDGETGFLANSDDEWISKILRLANNEKMLHNIGEKAYSYVRENYDIKKKYNLWEEVYV